MGRFRQGLFALGVSATAHVVVVAMNERSVDQPQLINPAALVWVDAEVPVSTQPQRNEAGREHEAFPSPAQASRDRAPRASTRHRTPAATTNPAGAPTLDGKPGATARDRPRGATGTPTEDAQPSREGPEPTVRVLTPRDDVLGPEVVEGETSGRTLYPGDEPTDAERLAEESERVHDRVDGWARQTLRRARVANGIVDPHYTDLQRELAAATDDVPDLIGLDDPKAVATALKDAWQAGAERYGRTGAPYDPPPGWNPDLERPESLLRQAQAGSPEMQNFVQFLSAGARLQEFADGRAGTALVTTVALTQAPDGSVLELRLEAPSGVKPFDTWVMDTARTRLQAVRFDAGSRERRFSSLWQFTGRVSFMKKAAVPTARTLATQIPLMVLSSLTAGRVPIAIGRFDEVTGTVETLDLSSPHYECTVTLLEAD